MGAFLHLPRWAAVDTAAELGCDDSRVSVDPSGKEDRKGDAVPALPGPRSHRGRTGRGSCLPSDDLLYCRAADGSLTARSAPSRK